MENENQKPKFEINIWITFEMNGISCIGRTIMLDLDGVPKEMVGAVDSAGMVGHLKFSEIKNVKKLTILKDTSGDKKYQKTQKEAQKLDKDYNKSQAEALDLYLIFSKNTSEA